MKYKLIVEIDEEALREAADDHESSVENLIEREAGWMSGSGIGVLSVEPHEEVAS
jgi:hypothetical protein